MATLFDAGPPRKARTVQVVESQREATEVKVLILEACRSPEVRKDLTEPSILSRVFQDGGIDYRLFSNDGIWETRTEIDKDLIQRELSNGHGYDVIHFAVHGVQRGLVLRWSKQPFVGARRPELLLTASDIQSLAGLQGMLVASGACSSARFTDDFLSAGAKALIAPLSDVPWTRIGLFFQSFYLGYRSLNEPRIALEQAVRAFPDYESYRVFDRPGVSRE